MYTESSCRYDRVGTETLDSNLLDGIGVQLGRSVDDIADKVVLEQAAAGIIVVDVDEEVIDVDRIYASSAVMAVKLLKATMNVKPPTMATKSGMMAILFVWEVVRTPPTWRATVDESWSAVYPRVCPR